MSALENNQSLSKTGGGRGGARKGAGRPQGAATKKTREIADKAAKEGITPLEYLLVVMRDPSDHKDPKVQGAREAMRFEAAKAAAPYCHARLQAIEHSGSIGEDRPLTDLEMAAKLAYFIELGRKRQKAADDAGSVGSKDGASAKPQASMHAAGTPEHVSATQTPAGTR